MTPVEAIRKAEQEDLEPFIKKVERVLKYQQTAEQVAEILNQGGKKTIAIIEVANEDKRGANRIRSGVRGSLAKIEGFEKPYTRLATDPNNSVRHKILFSTAPFNEILGNS